MYKIQQARVVFNLCCQTKAEIETLQQHHEQGDIVTLYGDVLFHESQERIFQQRAYFVKGNENGFYQADLLLPTDVRIDWFFVVTTATDVVIKIEWAKRVSIFRSSNIVTRISTFWDCDETLEDHNFCKCKFNVGKMTWTGESVFFSAVSIDEPFDINKALQCQLLPDGTSSIEIILPQNFNLNFRWAVVNEEEDVVSELSVDHRAWINYGSTTLVFHCPEWDASDRDCVITTNGTQERSAEAHRNEIDKSLSMVIVDLWKSMGREVQHFEFRAEEEEEDEEELVNSEFKGNLSQFTECVIKGQI